MLKLISTNVPKHVLKAAMRDVHSRIELHSDALNELGHQLQRTADALPASKSKEFLAALKFLAHELSLDESSAGIAIIALRALLHNYENNLPV